MNEKFVMAARLMHTPTVGSGGILIDGACIAIEEARVPGKDADLFRTMFRPDAGCSLYWLGPPNISKADGGPEGEARERRTWALLLAAVASEDFA